MQRLLALLSGTAIVGLCAASVPFSSRSPFATAQVTVHCRAGDNDAFVTPVRVEIARGDSVEWRMAGNVVSDSIIISLKNPDQAWPFAGAPSRGGAVARANAARTPGTYGYNVTLLCRTPGGGVRREVIDPDIIIGE